MRHLVTAVSIFAIAALGLPAFAQEYPAKPVAKIMTDLSIEGVGDSPAEMTAIIKQETERWGKVIRATGIKAE